MAVGALIYADRFNELKAKVKAECQRRNSVGGASGSVSVATYGGTSYDYTSSTAPAKGRKILAEHITKNTVPMNAIHTGNPDVSGSGVAITDSVLSTLETNVTTYATNLKGSATD